MNHISSSKYFFYKVSKWRKLTWYNDRDPVWSLSYKKVMWGQCGEAVDLLASCGPYSVILG